MNSPQLNDGAAYPPATAPDPYFPLTRARVAHELDTGRIKFANAAELGWMRGTRKKTVTPEQQILGHITKTIGGNPANWDQLTTYGWQGELEAAFLDSVLSVQAQYGNSELTGVRLRVRHWRDKRAQLGGVDVVLDDLSELAIFDTQPGTLAKILDNHQTLSGRSRQRPLKALAVAQAARLFANTGILHSAQITGNLAEKKLWCSVSGLGPTTWHYVLMLIGKPDVKADTMITRFVSNALGHTPQNAAVRTLIIGAATSIGVSATNLDYAIWSWQRRQR